MERTRASAARASVRPGQRKALAPREHEAILRLQRLAGNAAVAAFLQPGARRGARVHPGPSIQRACCSSCAGGGTCESDVERTEAENPVQRAVAESDTTTAAPAKPGGLISARFAGDPRLEACAADRGRLRQGDRGDSVTRVQHGLIDQGAITGRPVDLGAAGADGVYGGQTAAAVKAFKTNEELGFQQFGDVGPGTIRRLDSILSGAERPADADATAKERDEGAAATGSCPFSTDEEIVTGLQQGGLGKVVKGFTSSDAAQFGGGTTQQQVGATHKKIPDAVKEFQSKVDALNPYAGRNISNLGQMFWGHQLWQAVRLEIDRIGTAGAKEAAWAARAKTNADGLYNDPKNTSVNFKLQAEAKAMKSPERANMLALFAAPRGNAGALEEIWWKELNKTDTVPDFTKFRSLPTLGAVSGFDLVGCGTHVIKVAERLRKKGGIVPKDPSVKAFGFVQVAGKTGKRDLNPIGTSPVRYFGEVFSQSGVGSAVSAMQKALDGGQVLHARVVSGVGNGHDAPKPKAGKVVNIGAPAEEHSLIIIGFDGDKFVFHDPDAAVSKQFGGGFGFLFAQNGRLTTAEDDADLAVTPDGKHKRGDKRYQVIHISNA